MPLGTYTKPMRTGAFTAAPNAGVMASRKGSATAVPTPLRKLLRASALPVIILSLPPWVSQQPSLCLFAQRSSALCEPLHDDSETVGLLRSHSPEFENDNRMRPVSC